MINCPFCHWYRHEDTSKGAPPWNRDAALLALVEHLRRIHWNLTEELKRALDA